VGSVKSTRDRQFIGSTVAGKNLSLEDLTEHLFYIYHGAYPKTQNQVSGFKLQMTNRVFDYEKGSKIFVGFKIKLVLGPVHA
jgi:hypothetical protein